MVNSNARQYIYRWATESIEWAELESRAELLDVDLAAKAYLAVVVRLAAGGAPANEAARQIRAALSSALAPDYSVYSAVTPGSELILLVASRCDPSIPLIRRQIGFALNALSPPQVQ
ncbi:MAG: hypothetical protein LBL83_07110, partial [Clostridiales bacterium]|nr:hypothetical protein [Clostridiales bacterium]